MVQSRKSNKKADLTGDLVGGLVAKKIVLLYANVAKTKYHRKSIDEDLAGDLVEKKCYCSKNKISSETTMRPHEDFAGIIGAKPKSGTKIYDIVAKYRSK
jgi:hypothetical protein